jgi:hypothetical protein
LAPSPKVLKLRDYHKAHYERKKEMKAAIRNGTYDPKDFVFKVGRPLASNDSNPDLVEARNTHRIYMANRRKELREVKAGKRPPVPRKQYRGRQRDILTPSHHTILTRHHRAQVNARLAVAKDTASRPEKGQGRGPQQDQDQHLPGSMSGKGKMTAGEEEQEKVKTGNLTEERRRSREKDKGEAVAQEQGQGSTTTHEGIDLDLNEDQPPPSSPGINMNNTPRPMQQ